MKLISARYEPENRPIHVTLEFRSFQELESCYIKLRKTSFNLTEEERYYVSLVANVLATASRDLRGASNTGV